MEEGHHGGHFGNDHVLKTPIWIFAIRIAQIVVSIIILGLSADILSVVYFDEPALGVAVAVLTWLCLAYIIVTEKIISTHRAYHIIAVLALDGFMLIMWLATWANAAAERSSLDNAYDYCDAYACYRKREIVKRRTYTNYWDELAAIAGIGALEWILFIITFVWTMLMFFRGRKEGRFGLSFRHNTTGGPTTTSHQMEAKTTPQNTYTQPGPAGYANQAPQAGYEHQAPPAGYEHQAPPAGYANQAPQEGYGNHVPQQHMVPDHGSYAQELPQEQQYADQTQTQHYNHGNEGVPPPQTGH